MDFKRVASRLLTNDRDWEFKLDDDEETNDDRAIQEGIMRNVTKDPWLLLLALCCLLFLPFCALGTSWTREGEIDLSGGANLYGADVLLTGMLPGSCFVLVFNALGHIMAYHLGMDMLQETSTDFKEVLRDYETAISRAKGSSVSVKAVGKCGRPSSQESIRLLKKQAKDAGAGVKNVMRDVMKTSGLMLSLLLIVVVPLLRLDLPFEGDKTVLAVWFRILTLGSAVVIIKGLLVSTAYLAYMEPLGETAAAHFAFDNVNYLGEPAADIILSLVYFLPALLLWTFGVFGFYYGVVTCVGCVYTLTRFLMVFNRLSSWRNWIDVSETQRLRRARIYKIQAALMQIKKAEARAQKKKRFGRSRAPTKPETWAEPPVVPAQEGAPPSGAA